MMKAECSVSTGVATWLLFDNLDMELSQLTGVSALFELN